MRFSTWEGMWNNYQLVLVCLRHWGCSNLFINMPPDACHVTDRFGTDWAEIPDNIKRNGRTSVQKPHHHNLGSLQPLHLCYWPSTFPLLNQESNQSTQTQISRNQTAHTCQMPWCLPEDKLFAQLKKQRMKHSFLQHSREKWHAKPSFHVRRATHWACLCISRRHSRCMVWPQGMTVMSFIESNKYCTKHDPTCK
jgi:hypothetical protein